MAVTGQQIFNISMALIDEVQDDGTINASDTANYNAKAPSILTLGQSELLNSGEYFSTYNVTNSPVENLLGEHFDIEEFTGTDKNYIATNPKAYYFEVDNDATIYVEEDSGSGYSTLSTISHTQSGTGFTAYKGVLSPSSTSSKIRLRFSGSYFYRIRNIALYKPPFAAEADVPNYGAWTLVTMPSDFKSMSQITEISAKDYIVKGDYKWEGRNKLYISYDFSGELRITYKPIPTVISALTQEMQIDDITALTVLPYHLATHLMLDENPDIASYFNQKYQELKAESFFKTPSGEQDIKNNYGEFDSYGGVLWQK